MTGFRATKKGQACLSFRPGGMREVRSTGQDTSLPADTHRFCPRSNSQLPVEILDVELHCAKAQEQMVGNFLIPGPRRQEMEYFLLQFAQSRGLVYGHSLHKAIGDHWLE